MLRAVVDDDGSQRVLAEVPPYPIAQLDLRAVAGERRDQALTAIREEMGHRLYDPGRWPLHELRVSHLPERSLLHLSIEFLIADCASIQILLEELEALHRQPDHRLPALEIRFRDYLLAERRLREGEPLRARPALLVGPARRVARRARAAGRRRGPGQPARFQRHSLTLPAAAWAELRRRARRPQRHAVGGGARGLRRGDRHLEPAAAFHPRPDPAQPAAAAPPGAASWWATSPRSVCWRSTSPPAAPFGERRSHLDGAAVGGPRPPALLGRRGDARARPPAGPRAAPMPVVFTSAIGSAARARDGPPDRRRRRFGYGITQTPQVWIDCQVMRATAASWWSTGTCARAVSRRPRRRHVRGVSRICCAAWPPATTSLERPPGRSRCPPRRPNAAARGQRHRRPVPDRSPARAVLARARATPERSVAVCPARPDAELRASWSRGRLRRRPRAGGAGARPGDLVGVVMEKGWEQVVAVARHPARRWRLPADRPGPARGRGATHLLEDAGVGAGLDAARVVERRRGRPAAEHRASTPLGARDGRGRVTRAPPGDARRSRLRHLHLGLHRAAQGRDDRATAARVNTIVDINRRFAVGRRRPGARPVASLGFDLSVYDIFGPLAVGGRWCCPTPTAARDPSHWAELVPTARRHALELAFPR